MTQKFFAVYITTNQSNRVLYAGVTNDLVRRIAEHREMKIPGFTSKYRAHKLVYYEFFEQPDVAIAREKQIKAGSRAKKEALIESMNPEWKDLYNNITS
jgi:putative endonuclease